MLHDLNKSGALSLPELRKVIDDIGEFANLPKERYVPAMVAAGVNADGQPTAPLHSYPLVILFIKVDKLRGPKKACSPIGLCGTGGSITIAMPSCTTFGLRKDLPSWAPGGRALRVSVPAAASHLVSTHRVIARLAAPECA